MNIDRNAIENIINESHDRYRTQCDQYYMTQKAYYKSVLSAIIVFIGLSGSSFVWAFTSSNSLSVATSKIQSNEKRIENIEKKLTELVKEQKEILYDIRLKLYEISQNKTP